MSTPCVATAARLGANLVGVSSCTGTTTGAGIRRLATTVTNSHNISSCCCCSSNSGSGISSCSRRGGARGQCVSCCISCATATVLVASASGTASSTTGIGIANSTTTNSSLSIVSSSVTATTTDNSNDINFSFNSSIPKKTDSSSSSSSGGVLVSCCVSTGASRVTDPSGGNSSNNSSVIRDSPHRRGCLLPPQAPALHPPLPSPPLCSITIPTNCSKNLASGTGSNKNNNNNHTNNNNIKDNTNKNTSRQTSVTAGTITAPIVPRLWRPAFWCVNSDDEKSNVRDDEAATVPPVITTTAAASVTASFPSLHSTPPPPPLLQPVATITTSAATTPVTTPSLLPSLSSLSCTTVTSGTICPPRCWPSATSSSSFSSTCCCSRCPAIRPSALCHTTSASINCAMSDTCDLVASSDAWSSWHLRGETFYKQCCGLDTRESPNKELPTKVLKQDRVKDRQDIAQTLNFDRGHTILLTNKRCAGTQTQFSSFEFNRDEVMMITDTYHQQQHQQSTLNQQLPMVSQCHPQSVGVGGGVPLEVDTENVPLNLSVSNNNNNSNNGSSSATSSPANSSALSTHQQQQLLRPSVITCAFTNRFTNINTFVQPHSPSRRELTSGTCDPEEHFRRSLGKDYKKLNRQSPVPMARARMAEAVVSASTNDTEPDGTCNKRLILLTTQENSPSVDDHFARSLGNGIWSNIKAKRDVLIESVDDHFAKALGDTWHRIKAEQENHCDSRSSSPLQQQQSSQQQQQQQQQAQASQQAPVVST